MNLRNKLMLGCMALLVLVMATALFRVTTAQVLVKKLHIDNALTRAVLWDIQDVFDTADSAPNIALPWADLYPFATTTENSYTRLTRRGRDIEARVRKTADDKVVKWTSERLIKGRRLIELGRSYDRLIGWGVLNPELNVYTMQDDYLTFIYHRNDVTDRVNAVTELRDYASEYGAQLMFVQAPFKINKYGDAEVNGLIDFTNQNADDLLAGLVANGVRTYDLRQVMGEQLTNAEYHALFFRTDHHWRPETALAATRLLGVQLAAMGIAVDSSHWSLSDYADERMVGAFLGSQGKKVTLAYAEPEDISFYHAKFPTQIKLSIPSRGVDGVGDLDILYDEPAKRPGNIYYLPAYGAYSYGDVPLLRADNLLLGDLPEQKVLLIKDSFSDPVTLFLATGLKHLITVDMRHFRGSLQTFIARERPDVIVVMYTPGYQDKLDPNSNEDGAREFNFR